mmetsp:Transcript_40183/g.72781  ORF Transcript_40183/g.72781 Transcript_40183/m.72781 type:complete len:558 (+) Transcript_40183:41-1714(+)
MLTVVVFGATGDLAKKKLFPALYELIYGSQEQVALLPRTTRVLGYARGQLELGAFLSKQCVNVQGPHREEFLKQVSYFQGQYDLQADFARLHQALLQSEASDGVRSDRLFFLSVPATVFGPVCENISRETRALTGFTRLILEKPFGRDSRSFAVLNNMTSRLFREDQLFRIDHYLAKEKVLNLVAFRFANQLYEPLWNRQHIEHVHIVFKEDIGTLGRGGYFDDFGIIRDIMQNHLLQVMLWLAMEPPEQLHADCIAREKCRLLRATRTLEMKDCFLGQFTSGVVRREGSEIREPGYLEDSTVPADSKCPTFASVVLNIDNDRWRGVPFLMSAGKGLDERKAEVRITFKKQAYNALMPGEPNELVLRIQPDEGIYFKCINKRPGWSQTSITPVSLDMSYKQAFPESCSAPGAYERVLLNAAMGDRSLFVGSEELVEAWRIFTPLLDEIDAAQPQPVLRPFGSDTPDGFLDFTQARGIGCAVGQDHDGTVGSHLQPETSCRQPVATPQKAGSGSSSPSSGLKTKLERSPKDASGARGAEPDAATPPRKWRRLKSHDTF